MSLVQEVRQEIVASLVALRGPKARRLPHEDGQLAKFQSL